MRQCDNYEEYYFTMFACSYGMKEYNVVIDMDSV